MRALSSSDRPPLVLASLSGQSDAHWARNGLPYADAAVLGGIAIDERSRAAARELRDRDRTEFLPPDPFMFVADQLGRLEDAPLKAGINVRSATVEPIAEVARVCARGGAFLEINAHCRQPELRAVGCGEVLLADTDRLVRYVETAREAATDLVVGVKVRAGVAGVDLPRTCRALARAGAAYVHIDTMDAERVVADVADGCGLSIVANNGVRDGETVREYLAYGADAVSVGRPSTDARVLERVARALEAATVSADSR